nr:Chain C, DNA repair peptide [Saccharomyces cerevisiae S288C]
TRSKFFNK